MSTLAKNRKLIFEQALERYHMIPAWKCFSEKQLVILATQVAECPSVTPYGENGYTSPLDNSDGMLGNENDGGIFGSEDKGYAKAFDAFMEDTEKELEEVL